MSDLLHRWKIDVLLLSELSRLGRNVDEVLANIRFAKDNHLNIYFQKEGISIYGADSKENPYLTIMIAVQLVRDCYREKTQMRTNQSLVVMKARNNKELKETTELNKLNEPNDYMNPKSY